MEVSSCIDFKDNVPEPWARCIDTQGQMNNNELNKFRTTWCCKRYDHDHSLCRFAHIEVNKGWLRRDPSLFKYGDQICPHTTVIKSSSSALKGCHLNTCPDGVNCKYAHSEEEIEYHPRRYKSAICSATKPGQMSCYCHLRDICPKSHPENPRSPTHSRSLRVNHGKRSNDTATRGKCGQHGNMKQNGGSNATSSVDDFATIPAPIIFHKPAPTSEFEKTLLFPGLQSLYRRNCAMVYADFLGKKEAMQKYSNFGDNWEEAEDLVENNDSNTNCFSLYSSLGGK